MTPQKNTPDTSQIAALAHKLWEDEGRPDGRAEAHWQKALESLHPAKPTFAKAAKPAAKKANKAK